MAKSSIQISKRLQKELNRRKIYAKETYEEVIWQLIEDSEPLDPALQKDIDQAEEEISDGKSHSLEQVKKDLGI